MGCSARGNNFNLFYMSNHVRTLEQHIHGSCIQSISNRNGTIAESPVGGGDKLLTGPDQSHLPATQGINMRGNRGEQRGMRVNGI